MTQTATPQQQIENLKQSLLEAFVQRDAAEERIKAIRNVLAGIPIGQALATPAVEPDSGA